MGNWQERAAVATARRDASIAKVEPKIEGLPVELPLSSQKLPVAVLTEREIELTKSYPVPQLLNALKERKVSVEEVTRAFLRRAAVAQEAVWTALRLFERDANNTIDQLPDGAPMG